MSKTPTSSRAELLMALQDALRKVSAQSVLLSATVAKLVGLNSTDLECLDLLDMAGPTTAGHLAQHAGLTTGAMTAVIDRLERAGYVRRLRDPQDRRHVLVEVLPRKFEQIVALYQQLADATQRLHKDYDDRQLELVVDYLTRALALANDHLAWLQTQRPLAARARQAQRRKLASGTRRTAPLAAMRG